RWRVPVPSLVMSVPPWWFVGDTPARPPQPRRHGGPERAYRRYVREDRTRRRRIRRAWVDGSSTNHRGGTLTDALHVPARAGVDPDLLTGVDEEGDVDGRAGLDGRGLRATSGSISLEAGLGVRHLELDGDRELDADDSPVEHEQEDGIALLEPAR